MYVSMCKRAFFSFRLIFFEINIKKYYNLGTNARKPKRGYVKTN